MFCAEQPPIQAVPSALLQVGRRSAAVRLRSEDADVVEPQETALEDVSPGAILAVDPPGEIEEQFLEAAFQPVLVPLASSLGHLQRVR